MILPALKGRSIIQMAWLVPDLEAAMRGWYETFGIGPFFLTPHVPVSSARYRGAPTELDFSVAMAQAGEVQVELVEQHNDVPSCFRDLYPDPTASGMHHVAIVADDYDAEVERFTGQGFAVANDGVFGSARFCYVDTSPALGVMLEIVEEERGIRRFFDFVRDSAIDWDGRDPVRTLSLAAS